MSDEMNRLDGDQTGNADGNRSPSPIVADCSLGIGEII